MTLRYYFDEHMPRAVAIALTKNGVEVVMAADVGMLQRDDDTEHLPYAIEHNLVMVTFDHPFAKRTEIRIEDYPGLIYLAHSIRLDLGEIIRQLTEFAQLYDPERDRGKVFWLP
jgi:predicted nuclease of predicted toxin-antitoxin system